MFFELSADECKKLFENLKAAWTAAKDDIVSILCSENASWDDRADVVRETLVYLDKILGEVVLPRVLRSDLFQQVLSFIQELDVCFPFPISAISACCNSNEYNNDLFAKILAGLNECNITNFESYSYSVFNAYRFAKCKMLPSPPSPWLNALISVVHMKADRTFCTACGMLGSIFKYHFPSKVERVILLQALKNLLNTTSFKSSNDRFLMQDRYDYRQAATFLAAELYQMYQKRKQEIPSVLEEWHDLCKSPDELPDIRNTWMRV